MKLLLTTIALLISLLNFANIDSLLHKLDTAQYKSTLYNQLAQDLADSSFDLSHQYTLQAIIESKNEQNHLEEANAYCFLGELYYSRSNLDSALFYTQKSLPLYIKTNDLTGQSTAYNNIASITYNLGNVDTALYFFNLALSVEKKMKNDKGVALNLNNQAVILTYKGDYAKAYNVYKEVLMVRKKIGDDIGIANTLNSIAYIFEEWGDYNKATNYYLQSLKLSEKKDDKYLSSVTLNNIAYVYKQWGNYKKALDYFSQSRKLKQKVGDAKGLANNYSSTGSVYFLMREFDNALKYFLLSKEIYQNINHKQGIGIAMHNIGSVYTEKQAFDKAIKYHNKSLEISIETYSKPGISKSYLYLGKDYLGKKQYNKALEYAAKSLDYAKSMNNLVSISKVYEFYHNIYIAKNDYKSALQYYKKLKGLNDSLFNAEKHRQITMMNTIFEVEKKETENQLLTEKNLKNKALIKTKELQYQQEKTTKTFIAIAFAIVLIFGAFISFLYRKKQLHVRDLLLKNIELTAKEKELNLLKTTQQSKAEESTEKLSKSISINAIGQSIEAKPLPDFKYQNSQLDQEQKERLLFELTKLIENEKYYLKKDCNIENLSKKLNSNRKYVSQIINENFNLNFNNFINQYRIKEARHIMCSKEYSNYSIEGIADTVGFNSRVSFNNSFKKFTGITPSYFLNSQISA